jgi:hypothetical protein
VTREYSLDGTTWSASYTPPSVDGAYTVYVRDTDVAGNQATGSVSFTLDTTVPPPTGLDLATADDTFGPNGADSDNLTKNTSNLTISGSAEAGATLVLFDDANHDGIIDAGETLGTTTVLGDGTFSLDVSLGEGDHKIKAVQTDAAGNVSDPSDALGITVDTTPPAVSITGYADDTAPTGDGKTTDTTLAISGTAVAGSVVTVMDGATVLGTATANVSGVWTYNTPTLSLGGHSFTASATDAAGNTGTSGALAVTVETGATISGLHFAPNSQAGNSANLGGFVADNPNGGTITYDAVVKDLNGNVVANSVVDVNSAGTLVLGGSTVGQYSIAVTAYSNGVAINSTPFVYNLIIDDNQGHTLTFGSATTNNIGAGQGGADLISGSDSGDFLFGGSGNDRLIGNGGDDWVYGGGGNDEFRLSAPASNGNDEIVDFTQGQDRIGFLQGGNGWDAAGTSLGSNASSVLAASDYLSANDLSGLGSANNKVVELQQAQTTAYMQGGVGAAVNAYVVVYNSDTHKAEVWYDNNWSDTSGRIEVASIDSLTTLTSVTGLTNNDFVEWIV